MRILFIANDFPNPWAPTKGVFNFQLIKAMSATHDVAVIAPIAWTDELTTRRAGLAALPKDRYVERDGIPVWHPRYLFPPKILRSQYGWFYWRSIRKAVRQATAQHRPDAVLAYWAHPDGHAAIMAARLFGAASAVIVGGSDVLLLTRQARRARCVIDVCQNIGGVVAVNQHLARKVEELGVSPRKIYVWSQGVDQAIFHRGDRAGARRALQLPEGKTILLWVGRLVPVKGLHILLEACAILRNRGVPFALYLVGSGPLKETLKALCRARALEDVVHFVGDRQPAQLGDWYRAADRFVMSSLSEGLPNVLRESLACGTPFIASNVGGISEIAGPADRLFPNRDAAAMAQAIMDSLKESIQVPPDHRSVSWEESARNMVELLKTIPAALFQEPSTGLFRPRQWVRSLMTAGLPARRFMVRGPQRSGQIAISFDDGPDPEITPRVLDVLAKLNAVATFFVIGRKAAAHPELIRRIVDEGHALGSHTFFHHDPSSVSATKLGEEFDMTRQALAQATQSPVRLFRPPFGKLTVAKLRTSWRHGQTVVLWNRDPKDFAAPTAEACAAAIESLPLASGDIVLLHDKLPTCPASTRRLIERARQQGLSLARIDEWLGRDAVGHELPEDKVLEGVS